MHWSLLSRQIGRMIGMFVVVAFSSSLDVAAIEMELGLPLDYNRWVEGGEGRWVGGGGCSGIITFKGKHYDGYST